MIKWKEVNIAFLLLCLFGSTFTKNVRQSETEQTEPTEPTESTTPYMPVTDPNDLHGGVKMGVPSDFCDNGKDYITIDWDPTSTKEYTCTEGQRPPGDESQNRTSLDDALKPVHKCYPTEIEYEDPLPTSGPHRPLWPKYGEYTYVPVQRWLHSLEHGGIVFLYHPCADEKEVDKMRAIATGCMRRHIISPYKLIPEGYNFALMAWKNKLLLSAANVTAMVDFVKDRAMKGPEHVATDGQYSAAIKVRAKIVSNLYDQDICPNFQITDEAREKIAEDSKKRRVEADKTDLEVMETLKTYLEKKGALF